MIKSLSSSEGEHSLSSSLKLLEFVLSPWLALGSVVLETADGSVAVISLLDVSLVSLVDVVVEGVLEGEGVGFVGALDFDGDGADDGFV